MVEKRLEKSSLLIKLVIRGENFEISTEGTTSDIYRELDTLAQFATAVSEKLGIEVAPSPVISAEGVPTSVAEVPVIKLSRSTSKNIQSLFGTPWGKTPRTAAEVARALEVNAVPDRIDAVSTYLRRLVKSGILRRIEKEGKWAYFALPTE